MFWAGTHKLWKCDLSEVIQYIKIQTLTNQKEALKRKGTLHNTKNNSSSNWILMSCQAHRVTSGQSNSVHKQIHISKLFSHIYISTLCQVNLQNQSFPKHKTYIHKHQTQFFEELDPSIIPLLKEHIRLGHAGIINHSV